MKAATYGKLDCLEHLTAKGANLEATDDVRAALCQPPKAHPLCPSPSALAARRLCCPALTSAAHSVWSRRRASVERQDGPHTCGSVRQARLPRAPHRQGRQA